MKHWYVGFVVGSIVFSQPVLAAENFSAELQQLQQQLTQLQNQINQAAASPAISGRRWVASDFQNPLSSLSSPEIAYSLLQAQAQYPAVLTFGGYVSAAAQVWNGSSLNNPIFRNADDHFPSQGSALAATSADFYTLANLNTWTQALVTVEGGLNGYDTTISEAFINVGDLANTPFYATIGQTYLPFGTFPGNGLVTNTPETNAFESAELNQVDIGFAQDGFNATMAAFNGDQNLSDFVISVQDAKTWRQWTVSGGAGYMYDIRYAGNGIAAAYATSNSRSNIRTSTFQNARNGAVDLNGSTIYSFNSNQSLEGAAEWVSTTQSPTTIIGNIKPGRLQAWSLAGICSLPIWQKDTWITLDYSATIHMNAVPLQLPGPVDQEAVEIVGIKNQWLADIQSEIAHNVYVGPEFAWINLANGQHTWESAASLSVNL